MFSGIKIFAIPKNHCFKSKWQTNESFTHSMRRTRARKEEESYEETINDIRILQNLLQKLLLQLVHQAGS
jgi:hypothetical protein